MPKLWHHFSIWICSVLLLACLNSLVYAETATASAEGEATDVLIAKKILPHQQQATTTNANDDNAQAVQTNQSDSEIIQRTLPALNQPIIDQANILNANQNAELSQQIRSIHSAGKAQIGLVIVPSTGQEDIFSYAMRLADQWQLGTAKQDNGLLIVVAVNDRRIQILTGYGLEGVIPDIVAHQIIQNQITPYFKQGQYAQGLQAGLTEIDRILSLDPDIARQAAESLKEQQAEAHRKQQAQQNTFGLALFILIGAVLASYVIGRKVSALTAGVAGMAVGLFNGLSIGMSLFLGFGIFFLIISSIAQLLLHAFASSSGGGRGGGGFGGGNSGYRGGGGGFGGGGASGSW